MIKPADRLINIREYYFSQKLREVALMKAEGISVINMGIGSPDLPPDPSVTKALVDCSQKENSHGYQNYQGTLALREAIAGFYNDHYGVRLDPKSQVLPMMGSKEAIMHISMAFLNPGDKVLLPNPGYPTYTSVTNLLGAVPVYYDLLPQNAWLPDFGQLEKMAEKGIKLMWVNYPHMPTGAIGGKPILDKLARFAQKHDILLVNDNPYSFILNEEPESLLAVEGAMSHCLELNSLSKTFNMAGWRVGMLCGDNRYLQQVVKVKTNMDSGMFLGIQEGAVAALQLGRSWFENINQCYRRRKELVLQLSSLIGAEFESNTCGLFVWAKLHPGMDAKEFVDRLLQQNHIFIAPGDIFGSNGQGYVRFSLCVPEEQIKEAIIRLKSN